jgi:hypothetical protein
MSIHKQNKMKQIKKLVHENGRVTICDSNVVGISSGSCQKIFTQDLNMQWIATKLVSCLLTDKQKQNHVSIRPTRKLHNSQFLAKVVEDTEIQIGTEGE